MYAMIGGLISGLLIIAYNIYCPGEVFDFTTDNMTSDELKAEIEKLKEEEKSEGTKEISVNTAARQIRAEGGLRQRKGKAKNKAAEGETGKKGKTEGEFLAEAKERVMDAKLAEVDKVAEKMRGNEKLRNLLGVDDSELEKVVHKTKQDVRMGVTPSEPTNLSGWWVNFVNISFIYPCINFICALIHVCIQVRYNFLSGHGSGPPVFR